MFLECVENKWNVVSRDDTELVWILASAKVLHLLSIEVFADSVKTPHVFAYVEQRASNGSSITCEDNFPDIMLHHFCEFYLTRSFI